jgi:hypothetical protein
MPSILSLKSMSKIEKLRAMEELWTDLSRDEASFESPKWHLHELQKTETNVVAGKEEFIDWEEAKKSLRRRAR